MAYVLWQVAPNPKDLLEESPEGMKWVSAFFDFPDTVNTYTVVDFNGRRFAYKLEPR